MLLIIILSLNILQNQKFSLLHFVDFTKTQVGRRFLHDLLLQPYAGTVQIKLLHRIQLQLSRLG